MARSKQFINQMGKCQQVKEYTAVKETHSTSNYQIIDYHCKAV